MERDKKKDFPDIQNTTDTRGLNIDRVGVSDLKYPITVLDRANQEQHTIAHLSLSVCLPHHFKGTHMSRFIEILNRHRGEVTMRTIPDILNEMKRELDAETAHIEVRFPYFIEKTAPVSRAKALMDYDCLFIGESNGSKNDFILGVRVPVLSVCPCSKEISDYGAHNQRGFIDIEIRTNNDTKGYPELVWIEELVQVAEDSASAPVYALLKREDERHVTMQGFDSPVFVEDIVRNVAEKLRADGRIAWFKVHVVNQESIHNHSAFAVIEMFTERRG